MIPNTQYYGDSTTWLNATTKPYADDNAANKIPSYRDINGGITADKLTVNTPLDNSICYAGIAADSPIAQLYCINGADYENPLIDFNGDINFIWGYVDTTDQLTTNRQINLNDLSNTNETDRYFLVPQSQSEYPAGNIHRYFTPYVSIVPRNFVLLIYIECDTEQFNDRRASSLDDYINNTYGVSPSTHPNITSILVAPFGGNTLTGERSAMAINDNGGMALAYNIPYDLPQLQGIYDYWANAGYVKTTVRIWGAPNATYYNNYYQYVKGNGGTFNTDNGKLTYYKEYGDGEWILRCVASLGLFFAIKRTAAASGALDSEYMYCGTIDQNGLCHGDYTHGTDNRDQPQYTWTTTNDSTYDPTVIIPDYDDTNHFNPYISTADFNAVYVTNYDNVRKLANELYKAIARKPTDVQMVDYSAETFLVTDPLDGIISIRKYPVNTVPNHGITGYIKIGNYTSGTVQATRFAPSNNQFITFTFSGTKSLNDEFDGSFLDREPYTTAELYIPFCGTIPISVAEYTGHTINVKLAIDYRTGSCTAYVCKDNTPLQSANGQIGIDIGVSGINTATVDGQLLNANLSLKQAQRQQFQASTSFFTTPASIATQIFGGGKFGISGAAGSLGQLTSMGNTFENSWDKRQAASYELHHIQTPYKSISAGSPLCAAMGEHCCRLTIYRPIISNDYNAEIYAKTVGFACLKNGVVSDFSGLTIGAIDLNGVNCTDQEKSMIVKAFADGVYL